MLPAIALTLSIISLVVSLYAFVITFKGNSYNELKDDDVEEED